MNDIVKLEQPPITISSLDIERLEALLEHASYRHLPGVAALENELRRATVVDPADVPAGLVTMNSKVLFRDQVSNEEYGLTLVYPSANNAPGEVSILAPVGSALLGLSVGQSIEWQVPGGRQLQLQVLDVVYQPEANGELHR